MWFKQIKIFQLSKEITYSPDSLEEELTTMGFTPCLPSFSHGFGWVSPIELDNAPLIHAANQRYMLLCMQLEEKVLPATVVRQELDKKVKQIESSQGRKVHAKEKLSIKDELTHTLLSRAFSKLSRIYAYIDTKQNRLIVNTTTETKLEKLLTLLKKSFPATTFDPIETEKISPIITKWLLENRSPNTLSIEKSCLLSDPNQQNRTIRCQQQDLSVNAIQSLIKDGCQVNQLALNWQDKVSFTLNNDFSLRSIRYDDEVVGLAKENYVDSIQQEFGANFVIMTETLAPLLGELVDHFGKVA